MDLTELFGRFGSSRSNSKPNYLLSRSPSTITVAVVRSCSELYHNLARESKLMEEGRQKDLQLLEEIIDKCLTHKLLQTIASRDKIFEDQKAMYPFCIGKSLASHFLHLTKLVLVVLLVSAFDS
ncbi:uncharacterized protein LOC125591216 [Brassica napus]|uniref:uncharacterized protein LOC125591216 n=1 Tax=Brassica napus TaxID=3708 RepID=UPI00207AE2E9|nr:uncharacterized protein LOC125591216 [Brassica napus]